MHLFCKPMNSCASIVSNKPLLQLCPQLTHRCPHRCLSQNYYQILGVDPKSDKKRIRLSYLKLCKRYHPDLNQSTDQLLRDSHKHKLQDINIAYNCLINDDRRHHYDLTLRPHYQRVDYRDYYHHNNPDPYEHKTYYYSPNSHSTGAGNQWSDTRYSNNFKSGFMSKKRYTKQQIVMVCSFVVFMGFILHSFQYQISVRHIKRMENKWTNNGQHYQQLKNSEQPAKQRLETFEQSVSNK